MTAPSARGSKRLVATYGRRTTSTLAGYCDPPRLRAYMQAADLQVCSSAFENLSLAILEGMACGTPVLGTPGGGTPSSARAAYPQLVLPDDSAATMSDALPVWLADPGRLRSSAGVPGAGSRTLRLGPRGGRTRSSLWRGSRRQVAGH